MRAVKTLRNHCTFWNGECARYISQTVARHHRVFKGAMDYFLFLERAKLRSVTVLTCRVYELLCTVSFFINAMCPINIQMNLVVHMFLRY